jgi:hypothetical protein
VTVSRRGPSGRALEITVSGDRGSRALSGIAFARSLGLRSTLFDLHLDQAEAAPPPPPDAGGLQGLPEQAVVAPPDTPFDELTGLRRRPPAAASAGPATAIAPVRSGTGGAERSGPGIVAFLTMTAAAVALVRHWPTFVSRPGRHAAKHRHPSARASQTPTKTEETRK